MQVRFRNRRRASYEYEPLHEPNAIRLLRLGDEPDDTEDLHGTLVRTTLDQAPPYFALSYCWGKQKNNDTLFCDGKLLKITPSLAEAIRRLRTLSSDREQHLAWELEHRYFWIDQVCIDQANADERSSQVQMMGRIYSSALRTLIWLGPDPDGIAPAGFGFGRKILAMWQEETRNLGGFPHILATHAFDQRIANILQRLGQEDSGMDIKSPPWSSFLKLLRRPWTSRLWVIQEVALSAKDPVVLCGHSMCDWNQFSCIASFMLSNPAFGELRVSNLPKVAAHCVNSIRQIRQSTSSRMNMATLISWTYRMFRVSNPRDKVFALLCLAREGSNVHNSRDTPSKAIQTLPEALRPDYRTDTYEIYATVVRYFILECPNGFAPICRTLFTYGPLWTRHRLLLGRYWKLPPTWTPDWSCIYDYDGWTRFYGKISKIEIQQDDNDGPSTNIQYTLDIDRRWRAAGSMPLQAKAVDMSQHIKFQGIAVDTVAMCLPVEPAISQFLHGRDRKEWTKIVRNFLKDNIIPLTKEYGSVIDRTEIGLFTLYGILSGLRRPLTLRILEAATARRPDIQPLDLLQIICRMATSDNSPDGSIDREEVHSSHLQCLCAALAKYITKERQRTRRSHCFKEFDEVLKGAGGDTKKWEYMTWLTCSCKRFFVTTDGYMGIGPPGMKKGDIVSVLYGCGLPFILRRKSGWKRWLGSQKSEENDLFRMVGDSWIDGLMDGEAIEAVSEGRLQEQEFEIY